MTPIAPSVSELLLYALLQAVMVLLYPFGKRVSNYTQFWLGITIAWGVFFGAELAGFNILAHVAEAWSTSASLKTSDMMHLPTSSNAHAIGLGILFLAYVLCIVLYDTIYAFRDVRDDTKTNLKSLAVHLGRKAKPFLAIISAIQIVLLCCASVFLYVTRLQRYSDASLTVGQVFRATWCYFLYAIIGNAIAQGVTLGKVNLQDPENCGYWFQQASVWIGGSITTGFVAQYAFMAFNE